MVATVNKKPKSRKIKQGDPSITRAPPERWQRGSACEEVPAEDGGRHVQRVLGGLQELQREGRITAADTVSAVRWRRDYEAGVLGAKDPEQRGNSGSGGVGAWLAAVTDTVTAYRLASRAVGMRGDALLRAYVSDGLSIRGMWKAGMGERKVLAAALAETLATLTAHYADLQRQHEAQRSALRATAVDDDRDGEARARQHVAALGLRGVAPAEAVAIARARLAKVGAGATR